MTKQTEALIEIIDEQIEWIDGWEKAYPESIFSPVTEKESEALEQYKKHLGMRIAAQMARHIGKRFKEVIKTLQACKEALEQPAQEPDSRNFRHTEIPVAYTNAEELNELKSGMTTCYMYAQKIDDDDIALYTHR